MSFGVEYTAELYLNRAHFQNRDEVEDAIEEAKEELQYAKNKMLIWAAGNVKDLVPEEWKDDPVMYINNEIKENFDDIEEIIRRLMKLELLLENFDSAENV